MGKTYWKGLAMPTFLYAAEILEFNDTTLKILQRIDNQVSIQTELQLPTYTAVSNDGNMLVKEIFLQQYQDIQAKGNWIQQIKRYIQLVGTNLKKV